MQPRPPGDPADAEWPAREARALAYRLSDKRWLGDRDEAPGAEGDEPLEDNGGGWRTDAEPAHDGNALPALDKVEEPRQEAVTWLDLMVRSAKEWSDLVAGNPFPSEAKTDPARLVVVALKSVAKPGAEQALQAAIAAMKWPETVRVIGKNAYLYYPIGQGQSKLTINVIEKNLATTGTARNWNTAGKMQALAKTMDGE